MEDVCEVVEAFTAEIAAVDPGSWMPKGGVVNLLCELDALIYRPEAMIRSASRRIIAGVRGSITCFPNAS